LFPLRLGGLGEETIRQIRDPDVGRPSGIYGTLAVLNLADNFAATVTACVAHETKLDVVRSADR
jgi:hypothetical protein